AVIAGAAVISAAIGWTVLSTHMAYAVYVNGEEIGAASTRLDAERIVKAAEGQLSEILGYDYPLDGEVSVAASVGAVTGADEELENAIIGGVQGVSRLFAIELGGAVIGASEDETELRGIVDALLASYVTEDTVSAEFLDDVTVVNRFVGEFVSRDAEVTAALLRDVATVVRVEEISSSGELAFETVTVPDADMYEGETRTAQAGVSGEKRVTERVEYRNDVEFLREVTDSAVVVEPVAEIIAVGTAERPLTASYGTYIWPTTGVITSKFGYRSVAVGSDNHKGIDIAAALGQSIYAADGGVVLAADSSMSGYGLLVQILHDNGDVTYYGHNSELLVSAGERVYQGQEIAKMGATGVASGVHCHFEIRVGGEPVDPLAYLP
ncbi:MAG: peptidoglycan DD-metalloendopeptidase family protein, partial [Oscillospiraceae bacterium]|nr:peptidoglycan DD-metalloendopeptidase family protein [Oscillospiraceae bacterium]